MVGENTGDMRIVTTYEEVGKDKVISSWKDLIAMAEGGEVAIRDFQKTEQSATSTTQTHTAELFKQIQAANQQATAIYSLGTAYKYTSDTLAKLITLSQKHANVIASLPAREPNRDELIRQSNMASGGSDKANAEDTAAAYEKLAEQLLNVSRIKASISGKTASFNEVDAAMAEVDATKKTIEALEVKDRTAREQVAHAIEYSNIKLRAEKESAALEKKNLDELERTKNKQAQEEMLRFKGADDNLIKLAKRYQELNMSMKSESYKKGGFAQYAADSSELKALEENIKKAYNPATVQVVKQFASAHNSLSNQWKLGIPALDNLLGRLNSFRWALVNFSFILSGIQKVAQLFNTVTAAAIELETELANVAKTAGLNKAETASLRLEMYELSKIIPLSTLELTKVAKVAGQLGINKKEISAFTQTISQIAIVSGMTADSAATSFGKVTQAFGLQISEVYKLANVINELENTTAATTEGMIAGMERVGAASTTLGIKLETTSAAIATLISAGISPERAGTRLQALYTKMTQNSAKFAHIMDLTVNEFRTMLEEDPNKLFIDLVNIVSTSIEKSSELEEVWKATGQVGGTALLTMATNVSAFNDNLKTATDQVKEMTSVTKELNTYLETTASTSTMAKNVWLGNTRGIGKWLTDNIKKPFYETAIAIGTLASPMDDFTTEFEKLQSLYSAGNISQLQYNADMDLMTSKMKELSGSFKDSGLNLTDYLALLNKVKKLNSLSGPNFFGGLQGLKKYLTTEEYETYIKVVTETNTGVRQLAISLGLLTDEQIKAVDSTNGLKEVSAIPFKTDDDAVNAYVEIMKLLNEGNFDSIASFDAAKEALIDWDEKVDASTKSLIYSKERIKEFGDSLLKIKKVASEVDLTRLFESFLKDTTTPLETGLRGIVNQFSEFQQLVGGGKITQEALDSWKTYSDKIVRAEDNIKETKEELTKLNEKLADSNEKISKMSSARFEGETKTLSVIQKANLWLKKQELASLGVADASAFITENLQLEGDEYENLFAKLSKINNEMGKNSNAFKDWQTTIQQAITAEVAAGQQLEADVSQRIKTWQTALMGISQSSEGGQNKQATQLDDWLNKLQLSNEVYYGGMHEEVQTFLSEQADRENGVYQTSNVLISALESEISKRESLELQIDKEESALRRFETALESAIRRLQSINPNSGGPSDKGNPNYNPYNDPNATSKDKELYSYGPLGMPDQLKTTARTYASYSGGPTIANLQTPSTPSISNNSTVSNGSSVSIGNVNINAAPGVSGTDLLNQIIYSATGKKTW